MTDDNEWLNHVTLYYIKIYINEFFLYYGKNLTFEFT